MLRCELWDKFKSAVFFKKLRKEEGHVFTIVPVDQIQDVDDKNQPRSCRMTPFPNFKLQVALGSLYFSPFESAIILIIYIITI